MYKQKHKVLQVDQVGRQAAAACIAAVQLAALPVAADMTLPAPATARLISPNAQVPRYERVTSLYAKGYIESPRATDLYHISDLGWLCHPTHT